MQLCINVFSTSAATSVLYHVELSYFTFYLSVFPGIIKNNILSQILWQNVS